MNWKSPSSNIAWTSSTTKRYSRTSNWPTSYPCWTNYKFSLIIKLWFKNIRDATIFICVRIFFQLCSNGRDKTPIHAKDCNFCSTLLRIQLRCWKNAPIWITIIKFSRIIVNSSFRALRKTICCHSKEKWRISWDWIFIACLSKSWREPTPTNKRCPI